MSARPWNNWSPRRIDLAGIGVLVALTVAAYVLGIHPLASRHESVESEKSRLSSAEEELSRLRRSARTRRVAAARTREELAACKVRLQSLAGANRRLARLSQLADEAGLVVEGLQTGDIEQRRWFRVLPIRMTARCSYVACIRFLQALRKTFPDVGVAWLDLAAGATEGKTTTAVLRIKLLWYVTPETTTDEAP